MCMTGVASAATSASEFLRTVNPEHRKTPPDLNRFVAMTKPWRLLGAVKRWPAVKHIYVHDGSSISSNICVRIPPDSKPRTSEDTPRSKPLCRHDKALTASRSCEEVASRKAFYVHDGSSISSNICVRIPPDSKPRTSEDTPRSKPLCRHDKALTASRSCEEVASRKAYLCAWRE